MIYRTDEEWNGIWNDLHVKHITIQMENAIEGVFKCGKFRTFTPQEHLRGYRNSKMADWLEETLLGAKKYYYAGNSIMSDRQFDRFENYLKLLRPNSQILEKVGY